MTSSKVVQIDVQLNTNEIKDDLMTVSRYMEGLKKATVHIGNALKEAFNLDFEGINSAQINLDNIARDMDLMASKMTELVEVMAPKETGFFDGILSGIDGFNTIAEGIGNLGTISEAINDGYKAAKRSKEGFNIFKALIPDTIESFQHFSEGISTAFGGINIAMNGSTLIWGAVIAAVIAGIALIIANWDSIKAGLETVGEWINTNVFQPVVGFFTGISEFMQGIFAKDWTEQFGAFGNVLNAFFANVENVWNAVKSIFGGIVDFVKNVFAGDWGAAWDSVVGIFKGIWDLLVSIVKAPINIVIGLINGLVQGVVDGINLVINALNGLSFDVPDWVPVLGGQKFGFNLTPLVAPKIPLLAKGAVLPANKPFLAMVGDQRHGTNVEAPLATIQEAVAMVMEDQFNGMMAGFEAVTARQEQILETLLGIEIGDTTIGQAAARYNRKMAIIKGGM